MLTLATEIWRSNVSETLRPRLSLPMIFYLMEANSLAITNMLVEWWGVGPNLTMQTREEIPARWRGGVAAVSRGSRHVIISRTTFLGCMLHIAAYCCIPAAGSMQCTVGNRGRGSHIIFEKLSG